MINENNKTSLGVLTEKSKTSDEDPKHRILPKGASCIAKIEAPTNRKTPIAGSVPPDSAARNSEKACDPKLKMKMMGLTPRNRAKETSEGVQEFIKHVSDIIERKNPFKETAVCSWPRGSARSPNSPVIDSVQFNGGTRKTQERNTPEDTAAERNRQSIEEEIHKAVLHKIRRKEKLNSAISPKKEISVRGKVKRPRSSSKKRAEKEKKQEEESSPQPLRVEAKPIKKTAAGKENQEVKLPPTKTPHSREKLCTAPLQNQVRRRRPSEIPLRKNRTDSTSKPKPLFSLRKKSPENNRKESFDTHLKKPGSPCQELQMTINVDLSSAEISIIGERIEPGEQRFNEEINDSIKLDRCYKRPNILDVSPLELSEEKPFSARRKMDIEKVKTSSFTVLTTNSNVLNRLESLHKKNVLSKEKSLSKKTSSQKVLATKASISSLKGSKKTLMSRASSKGNKPGLRKKIKKPKKPNLEPENPLPVCNDTKRKAETPVVQSRKVEIDTNDGLKSEKEKRSDGKPQTSKSNRGKSTPKKAATPRDAEENQMPSEKPESEYQKQERPKSVSTSSLNGRNIDTLISYMSERKTEIEHRLEAVQETPKTPPPTPNTIACESLCSKMEVEIDDQEDIDMDIDDGDEWSSKTVIFDDKFNYDTCTWNTVEQDIEELTSMQEEPGSAEDLETTAGKHMLCVAGTQLNVGKDEPPEKPEGQDTSNIKKILTIDLSTHGATSTILEQREIVSALDSKSEEVFVEEPDANKTSSSDAEKGGSKEGRCKSRRAASDLFSSDVADEPRGVSLDLQKPLKSCSSLKRKPQSRSGGHVKGGRKKSLRSDAGDRPSPTGSILFNPDMPLQNKSKPDTKVRSGLTKATKREDKLEVFEDASSIKLKRRNSEPNSFRGYVWKCADSVNPKDQKASVSSLTSSLRHLNTDEIDDFIFWEAVPQKTTSCWETSLYHFKRPWSVLSCSVFRDNRKSSTPGLILENLRNGGTLNTRRCTVSQDERVAYRNENPFDVEPSIAQKNIDIRNWLAALNFPTLPSTSTDVLSEGNFSTQVSIDGQNLNKTQVSQKRRKVLPNLKFSEEIPKKKSEEKDKHRKSTKWCDDEGLTQLVRRKSGGFVTCEQFLNSEYPNHRANVTVNLCVYSKSAEESVLAETGDRTTSCEPRKYKSVEIASQPEVSISATIINSGALVGDQLVERTKRKEKSLEELPIEEGESESGKILKREINFVQSDVNIWKYLFIFTVFIIVSHYCYINSFMCGK